MKLAYIDDNPKELDTLREYISQMLSSDTALDTFSSGEEFFSRWKSGAYDLIFLDIYMEKTLGVDIARKIRETDRNVRLVFCTTSNEFASESYEVNAQYYLLKPFTTEKVKSMLDRLNLDELEHTRMVTLSDGQNLLLHSIIYTEYAGHTATIHSSSRKDIRARVSQTELEKTLCAYPFIICCSKGILVNLYEVEKCNVDLFIMKNGDRVPISRRKQKEISEIYNAFRFEKIRKGGKFL